MIINTLSLRTALRQRLYQKLVPIKHVAYYLFRRSSIRDKWLPYRNPRRKKCFIIAGGKSFAPEIAEYLIKHREQFDVFAINFFHDSSYSDLIVPDYYVISDPDHFRFDGTPLGTSNRHLKKYIDRHKPCIIAPRLGNWHLFSDQYLPFNDLEDLSTSNISPLYPRGYTSNTAFKAIAAALYMNYTLILLSGFDHNYATHIFVDVDGRLYLKEQHHHCPDSLTPLSDLFESSAHALHCYALNLWTMRHLSSPRILNISDDTLVDCFRRVKIQDFLLQPNHFVGD